MNDVRMSIYDAPNYKMKRDATIDRYHAKIYVDPMLLLDYSPSLGHLLFTNLGYLETLLHTVYCQLLQEMLDDGCVLLYEQVRLKVIPMYLPSGFMEYVAPLMSISYGLLSLRGRVTRVSDIEHIVGILGMTPYVDQQKRTTLMLCALPVGAQHIDLQCLGQPLQHGCFTNQMTLTLHGE
ncbi:hypothetical protein BGW41_006651 [Actinomortierella wolfii]|nr:hypothetical protein BGW41_006651 [Actinomortierella wolfii]